MTGRGTADFFDQMPGGWLFLWLLSMAITGLALLVAVAQTAIQGALGPPWQSGFMLASALLLMPLPFAVLHPLLVQRAVWLGRVAPRSALQRAQTRMFQTLTLSWLLWATPLALLMNPVSAPGGGLTQLLLAPAVLAAVLGLSLLAAAAWQGLLRAPFGLPWLLLLVAVSAAGMEASWQALDSAHPVGPVLMGLLLPLAMARLRLALEQGQGQGQGQDVVLLPTAQATPRQRTAHALAAFSDRWRPVDGASAAGFIIVLWPQIFNQFNSGKAEGLLMSWGSGVSLLHGLRVLGFAFIGLTMLRSTSLHWRHLLAPTGGLRRRLGIQIVWTTFWTALALMALVGLAGFMAISAPTGLESTGRAQTQALVSVLVPVLTNYLPSLVVDLLLGAALASWLRGWLGSFQRAAWALLACAAAWAIVLATLHLALGQAMSDLWHRGPLHHTLSLLLALLLIALGQRAWARADLGELMQSQHRRPVTDPDGSAGRR